MVSAIFACVFGILGILTLGIVFVPLAALCTLFGLISAVTDRSASVLFMSILGVILTGIGWVASPSMWVLTAALIGASAH